LRTTASHSQTRLKCRSQIPSVSWHKRYSFMGDGIARTARRIFSTCMTRSRLSLRELTSCALNGRTSGPSFTRIAFALCSAQRHWYLEQSPIRFVPHRESSRAGRCLQKRFERPAIWDLLGCSEKLLRCSCQFAALGAVVQKDFVSVLIQNSPPRAQYKCVVPRLAPTQETAALYFTTGRCRERQKVLRRPQSRVIGTQSDHDFSSGEPFCGGSYSANLGCYVRLSLCLKCSTFKRSPYDSDSQKQHESSPSHTPPNIYKSEGPESRLPNCPHSDHVPIPRTMDNA
jgi:hypothetical protein